MEQKRLLIWRSDDMKKQQVSRQVVDYTTKRPSKQLLGEIKRALKNIKAGYGSVEIIVQSHRVVQITERNIKKTVNSNLNRS